MAITRTYCCNLCRDHLRVEDGDVKGIGLYWGPDSELRERPARSVEHHVCYRCLSSLQGFVACCGAGFRNCTGGPRCGSDHK